jgi:hypothetical protein
MEKQHINTKISLQGRQGARRETFEEADEQIERPDRNLPDLVRKALEAFEKQLGGENFKPTLSEYLKLLQFEQEVTKEDKLPREITVTWVEPVADYSEE